MRAVSGADAHDERELAGRNVNGLTWGSMPSRRALAWEPQVERGLGKLTDSAALALRDGNPSSVGAYFATFSATRMITPKFSCSQSDSSVVVSIYCPSVRVSETLRVLSRVTLTNACAAQASEVEINVDETLLTVHVNPYFLRLNFPGSVVEDDDAAAAYDPGAGQLTVTLTKVTKGEDFKDLDLLAKLLAPRTKKPEAGPSIEVIASEESGDGELAEALEGMSLNREQREILEGGQTFTPRHNGT
jgi:hypothetical protein